MIENHRYISRSSTTKHVVLVNVGDWVIVREGRDEVLHRGFVTHVTPLFLQVVVVHTEGEILESQDFNQVTKFDRFADDICITVLNTTEGLYYEEAAVRNMIDWALISRDETLFLIMSARLNKMQNAFLDKNRRESLNAKNSAKRSSAS